MSAEQPLWCLYQDGVLTDDQIEQSNRAIAELFHHNHVHRFIYLYQYAFKVYERFSDEGNARPPKNFFAVKEGELTNHSVKVFR